MVLLVDGTVSVAYPERFLTNFFLRSLFSLFTHDKDGV
jgi:hypothetical protein